MCFVQEIIFDLKEGITLPHQVKIVFSKSGTHLHAIVGNEKIQRMLLGPCREKEKGCSGCGAFPGQTSAVKNGDIDGWVAVMAPRLFPAAKPIQPERDKT